MTSLINRLPSATESLIYAGSLLVDGVPRLFRSSVTPRVSPVTPSDGTTKSLQFLTDTTTHRFLRTRSISLIRTIIGDIVDGLVSTAA